MDFGTNDEPAMGINVASQLARAVKERDSPLNNTLNTQEKYLSILQEAVERLEHQLRTVTQSEALVSGGEGKLVDDRQPQSETTLRLISSNSRIQALTYRLNSLCERLDV